MKRGPKKKSPAYLLASKEFREAVLSKGKCALAGHIDHECGWPMDPAHILTKQFLKDQSFDLAEPQQLACIFDPRIGWPLCRSIHANVQPDGFSRTAYLDWLPTEAIDFATEWDLTWKLEDTYPRLDPNYEPPPPF